MKFSIDTQQGIIRNWYYRLGERAKNLKVEPVKDLKTALEAVNLAHDLYRLSTKTTWGYIRSFIPFSSAYSRRVVYHNCAIIACSKLTELQTNIETAEKTAHRKVSRATSEPLPVVHGSPIGLTKRPVKRSASMDFTRHYLPRFTLT